jgi:hypothetical protein
VPLLSRVAVPVVRPAPASPLEAELISARGMGTNLDVVAAEAERDQGGSARSRPRTNKIERAARRASASLALPRRRTKRAGWRLCAADCARQAVHTRHIEHFLEQPRNATKYDFDEEPQASELTEFPRSFFSPAGRFCVSATMVSSAEQLEKGPLWPATTVSSAEPLKREHLLLATMV